MTTRALSRSKSITPTPRREPANGAHSRLPAAGTVNKLHLRLYIAGQSPKSIAALSNLRDACEKHLPGKYAIEIVDLSKNPQLARGDQILALPTVVRRLPQPIRRMIGDLSDREKLLIGLDLRAA